MKQIKLRRLVVAIWLVVNAPILLADELAQKINKNQMLYKKGYEAYQNKDYISALKYLYAYRVANENKLPEHENFTAQIDEAITISEHEIRNAINSCERYAKEQKFNQRYEAEGSIDAQGY